MKIQKRFIKFLKDEGIFGRYAQNVKYRSNGRMTIHNRKDYINHAFNWHTTFEGVVFWRGYNIKWQKLLKSLEKKDPALYKTRCGYCGRFVKKDFWVVDGSQRAVICKNCIGKIEVDWS